MSLTFNTMNSFYHSENEGRMTCPVCGKKFDPAPEHVYHIKRGQKNFVCSWSCMRKWEKGDIEKSKAVIKTKPKTEQKTKPKTNPKVYKFIKVVETGEIFCGVKACAEHLNAPLSSVYKALYEGKACHGFHIEAVREGEIE